MEMIADCQMLAAEQRPTKPTMFPLLRIATSGSRDENGKNENEEATEMMTMRANCSMADQWQRRRRRRRKGIRRRREETKEVGTTIESSELELMMKKESSGEEEITTKRTMISDQTLALGIGKSHYEDELSISNGRLVDGGRSFKFRTRRPLPPTGSRQMTKRGGGAEGNVGRRSRVPLAIGSARLESSCGTIFGNRLGRAISFTTALMILATITLANTLNSTPTAAVVAQPPPTTTATTTTMTSARAPSINYNNNNNNNNNNSKSELDSMAAGGRVGASPIAARTIEDKTNDDDDDDDYYPRAQSMFQQQQQQGIPFKTPLRQRAPQHAHDSKPNKEAETTSTTSTTTTNNSTTMMMTPIGARSKLARRAALASGGGNNINKVAYHPLAQQAQSQQQLQFLQQLRISETDLLPFSDFSVQQPAFSEIMKSWPPTTRQKQQQQHNDIDNYMTGGSSKRHRQRPGLDHHNQRHYGSQQPHQSSEDDPAGQWQIRNHLNEDYDDTIVTADESFEQDQLPEPPTWVNYLGELGDLIYVQLSQLMGASDSSQSSSQTQAQNQSQLQQQQSSSARNPSAGMVGQLARQQRLEIIEDLLDDFYYDQYENSQVLYYGPQLVHQGDIFEIGCYLPNEQPAEWTKSGRLLVSSSGGSARDNNERDSGHLGYQNQASGAGTTTTTIINPLRVVKRTNFMGAKQNYSLKVFEAQLSDSGNYRCNRLSRKYHKLIVVPQKISLNQQYLYQQRLLSVVGQAWQQQQQNRQQGQPLPQVPALIRRLTPSLTPQQIQLATLYQTSALLKLTSSQQQQQHSGRGRGQAPLTIQASGGSGESAADIRSSYSSSSSSSRQNASSASRMSWPVSSSGKPLTGQQYLTPSHIIHEHQPLSVQCYISDERILLKLREMPQFQLAWYKNGKLLRGSQPYLTTPTGQGGGGGGRPQQPISGGRQPAGAGGAHLGRNDQQQPPRLSSQRIQFVGPNGRQMYIGSPNYADAGDYLCSWARLNEILAAKQQHQQQSWPTTDQDSSSLSSAGGGSGDDQQNDSSSVAMTQADYSSSSPGGGSAQQQQSPSQYHQQLPINPASAASHHQLVAPVKLRPFKSAYYVRAGNQLRLICQVQRGYPSAFISWYIGNQLVDSDFLRDHPNEYQVLQLLAPNRLSSSSGSSMGNSSTDTSTSNQDQDSSQSSGGGGQQQADDSVAQIVEINPIPAGRQQMQLTANGRGQWIEYRELANEKHSIDSPEKQLRYMQMKLAQLTGVTGQLLQANTGGAAANEPPTATSTSSFSPVTTGVGQSVGLLQQASLSVLVVNRLQQDRHTSRYACRATGRANTDEVTTVIRVKDPQQLSSSQTTKPPLWFPDSLCTLSVLKWETMEKKPQFVVVQEEPERRRISAALVVGPNQDDTIEIHNERLTLLKPNYQSVGDYICSALDDKNESETIQVRAAPYVEDFGVETSHTGKSATLNDGDRLELNCRVRDQSVPVNITWLMSQFARQRLFHGGRCLNTIRAKCPARPISKCRRPAPQDALVVPTYTMPNNVMVERTDSFSKRLIIRQLGPEHRGYYTCMVDNNVTERTRKTIYIRVKDKILPLWPFLGILAELFILFTIIYVWETQKAQKSIVTNPKSGALGAAALRGGGPMPPQTPGSTSGAKRAASGPSNAFESVPLNG